MIKYGVIENGPGYNPSKKYWCSGSYLSWSEKQYWEQIRGIVVSHNINAVYRYRSALTTMWPALTYYVKEYDE